MIEDDIDFIDYYFVQQSFPKIDGLNLSSHKVYYLEDYIPVEQGGTLEQKHLRADILRFKNYKDWVKPEEQSVFIEMYSHKILKAVDLLASTFAPKIKNIVLTSVPCSKVNKTGPIHACLDYMRTHPDQFFSDCHLKFYSCSLFKRTQDVIASHESKGKRASDFRKHLQTITFIKKKFLYYSDIAIILLDDVTTSGAIMDACTELLLQEQIFSKKIFRLALAGTQNQKYKKIPKG